jgi:hypothetical protein
MDERREQDDSTEAWVDRMGRALNTARTPRQAELADTIYKKLRQGADVRDVAHLIGDLSRTMQRRRG